MAVTRIWRATYTEHGGPVRMVVPKRYAWKSAKWLKAFAYRKY